MDLVRVNGWALVMVVAIAVAPVDVQHCRLGVEAEESQAKHDCDEPHLGQVYLKQDRGSRAEVTLSALPKSPRC